MNEPIFEGIELQPGEEFTTETLDELTNGKEDGEE